MTKTIITFNIKDLTLRIAKNFWLWSLAAVASLPGAPVSVATGALPVSGPCLVSGSQLPSPFLLLLVLPGSVPSPDMDVALASPASPAEFRSHQQDPQEFLRKLLTKMKEKKCKDIFNRKIKSHVKCNMCNSISTTTDDIEDISLSIWSTGEVNFGYLEPDNHQD